MSDKRPIAVDLDGALIMPAEVDTEADTWVFLPKVRIVDKPMSQPYSHRNGETEPPTIFGWYWISDQLDKDYFYDPDIYCVHKTEEGDLEAESYDSRGSSTPIAEIKARWWGPIPKPPWEAE